MPMDDKAEDVDMHNQRNRVMRNIEHMDTVAEGGGRIFTRPETAREIADDLKDLNRRIDKDLGNDTSK